MPKEEPYENTTRTIETRIGTLEYVGGFPTDATVRKAYDALDAQRAVQVYLEFMPFMSQQAIFDSHERESGLRENRDVAVYDYQARGKVEAEGLTYNTESIYSSACVNVETGPIVIESPPNVLGVINDGWFRFVTDLGIWGPDQGEGGTFVLAHVDDPSPLPDDAFVYRTATYRNWLMCRAFVTDTGEGQRAIAWYRENLKIYPLGGSSDPAAVYMPYSEHPHVRTTHRRDITFYERLAEIVEYEPAGAFDPYELGVLMSIGIAKGRPFDPDERMRELLSEGIVIGDAIAKANAYSARLDGVRAYPDREYEHLFLPRGRHDFIAGDALWIDARTLFHYEAIVVTPAMVAQRVGVGSQYLASYRDATGAHLMGQHHYRMHLPAGIPAANFWSVTMYHPETRSLLITDQDKPAKNSYDDLEWNDDGSIDLYFGPEPPDTFTSNWLKTLPGEGWQILFRLYGPLEPYFDESWKPDDIVRTS